MISVTVDYKETTPLWFFYIKICAAVLTELNIFFVECGIRPAYFKTATRVVGGDEVKPGTWPWMVSLHGGVAKKFFCGGTIIHPQWILTAGHCVGEGYARGCVLCQTRFSGYKLLHGVLEK